jgi:hypothetical protein
MAISSARGMRRSFPERDPHHPEVPLYLPFIFGIPNWAPGHTWSIHLSTRGDFHANQP